MCSVALAEGIGRWMLRWWQCCSASVVVAQRRGPDLVSVVAEEPLRIGSVDAGGLDGSAISTRRAHLVLLGRWWWGPGRTNTCNLAAVALSCLVWPKLTAQTARHSQHSTLQHRSTGALPGCSRPHLTCISHLVCFFLHLAGRCLWRSNQHHRQNQHIYLRCARSTDEILLFLDHILWAPI